MAKDAKWYAVWVSLANARSAEEKLTNLETAEFIENLAAELEAVKRDRDALMEDFDKYRIRNIQQTSGVYACDLCKYGGDPYRDDVGKKCPKGCYGITNWKWRGPCDGNGGVEA